jgi:hypothetical protein
MEAAMNVPQFFGSLFLLLLPGLSSAEEFPEAQSKKGLQVEIVDDALALGIKHAAINVNLAQMAMAEPRPNGTLKWRFEGKDYHYTRAYVERLDRQILPLSERDVLVYLIILVYQSHDEAINDLLLHPNYDRAAPNRLGAFNTSSPDGRQWLKATMAFMAARWSPNESSHGRAVGYILGNEVNSHWWWSNMGRVSMETFTDSYAQAMRLAHQGIRSQAAWPRLYLSLEHHWNIRYPAGSEQQAFPGRAFLDLFARVIREGEEGDFDWHVAFHPYPENLFEPRFWQDKTATEAPDTPRITFKNLGRLMTALKQPELLYQGKPRRVILSEQGFHTPDGAEGERVQAAAYCYAYRLVEQQDGIDAFILHRHVDHPREGGLRLGLRRYLPDQPEPRPTKLIYDCFRLADTPQWEDAFRFALPVVGRSAWPMKD